MALAIVDRFDKHTFDLRCVEKCFIQNYVSDTEEYYLMRVRLLSKSHCLLPNNILFVVTRITVVTQCQYQLIDLQRQ